MRRRTYSRAQSVLPRFVVGRPAWAAAILVFALAAVGLSLVAHRSSAPFSRGVAVRDALRAPDVRRMLAADRWTSAQTSALDQRLERVDFLHGSQVVAEVALNRAGRVEHSYEFARQPVPYGNWIAYQPVVLIGLSLLFIAMTAVVPLWRLRNLDVMAALSLVAPVVLLQHRYVAASVLAAGPGLLYLLVRSARWGLRDRAPAPGTARPLFMVLTTRLSAREHRQILWMLFIALALVFAMVGISSSRAVDVVYAVMEGASKVVHGVLPYGHLPGDVVHGDTYPIFSYLAYAPLAVLAPVTNVWDSVDLALGVTALAAVLAAGGIVWSARSSSPTGWSGVDPGAVRSGIAWLSFPPLLIMVSSGTSDVLLATMLVFAVLVVRRPRLSVAIVAIAGWFKLAPFSLLPLWVARLRGRGLLVATAVVGLISAAMLAVVLILGGPAGIGAMIRAISYQASRGSPQSIWAVLNIAFLQPVGEAAILGLIAGATITIRCSEAPPTPERMAALSASILIGLQLSASYWSFLYTAWVVPVLCMSLLADRQLAAQQRIPVASSVELTRVPVLV